MAFYSAGHLILWSALETRTMGKYTNTPWLGCPLYHDRSTILRPTSHHIWQFWFLWSQRAFIQTWSRKSSVRWWGFDGSQEPLSTGKGPSAPEVTSHTSRQNYPQYYIRIYWPVTWRQRNVGCETAGMLYLYMANSVFTTNSPKIITEIYNYHT